MLYYLSIPVAIIAIVAIASHLYRGRSLTRDEAIEIAQQMRISALWKTIQWSQDTWHSERVRDIKKQMKPGGGIHECDEDARDFVAFTAALLKHKKHEWFVVGWASKGRVSYYWCNKGPDRTMVIPGLGPEQIVHAAQKIGATVVYDLHNHPNSSPQRLDCSQASTQDLKHARYIGEHLASHGLAYIAFVAERGVAYPYAIFVPPTWSPFSQHINSIETAAQLGGGSRRSLRNAHALRIATTGYNLAERCVHNLRDCIDLSQVN